MKKSKHIPKSIKSILWPYDINDISLEEDKETIITQCLNYGTLKEVRWLFKAYGEEEIKKVVAHPKRGRWWRKVLNFWLLVLDINLPKEVFENAVIKIKPEFRVLNKKGAYGRSGCDLI